MEIQEEKQNQQQLFVNAKMCGIRNVWDVSKSHIKDRETYCVVLYRHCHTRRIQKGLC